MRKATLFLLGLAVMLCVGSGQARLPERGQARMSDFAAHEAVMDSLSRVPPRFRGDWLRSRGLEDPFVFATGRPDSGGLRLVGKYGRGPAREVTGQDSLLFLSNGSAVAIFSIADPGRPTLLTEIQARSIVSQSVSRDGLLYVADYAELSIWDVTDPARPGRLSVIPYGTRDFALSDSLLAFTHQDTFRVYSVADPADPRELGTLPDSGTVRTASGSRFILGSQQDIIYIIDCSDPARPQRRGSHPGYSIGLAARGDICCAAVYWHSGQQNFRFDVLDISNPDSIRRIGWLAEVGGYDIHLDGPLAFVSGYQSGGFEFTIVSIADSTNPVRVGQCATPGDNDGVWGSFALDRAYVADRFRGLTVIDISNLGNPILDTSMYYGGVSMDVAVNGGLACVASDGYGMVLLDVSAPSLPVQLGAIDSTRKIVSRAVALADSFAYMGYSPSLGNFKSIDIADPTRPVRAGGVNLFNWPEALALRDSFAYVAEANRFEVVNVARPREPVLVGSCEAGDATSAGLSVRDTLAFVGNFSSQIISIADPTDPVVVGTFWRGAWNIAVRDTYAFVSSGGGIIVYSISDPTRPYALDSLSVGPGTLWVEAVGTLLYTAHRDGVRVVDASDVRNMREVGFASTPYTVKRLHYASPYVYAAMWDAGVAIFESTQVAVTEPTRPGRTVTQPFRIEPNPAGSRVRLVGLPSPRAQVTVWDVSGRLVAAYRLDRHTDTVISVAGLPSGLYFIEARTENDRKTAKFVKR